LYLTTDQFAKDARSAAEDNLMPTMRIVELPARRYYTDRGSLERIRPVARAVFDQIIAALTQPLSPEEQNIGGKGEEQEEIIKITAENYDLALEKLNEFFLKNKWSDGLPIIPPTRERVKWILSGTRRSPGEVIGTVKPKNGIATVEKIAVNAAMAGAKPEYFPVILAVMEALTDRNYDTLHVMLSSGSFNLIIAVSGPIGKEINMNSGIGYLGYGYRANSTIGRAVRLSMINLGHLWPAENDMALVGRASSHTFLTFAENQEASPWAPYHVSQGFNAEDSCVTVATVGGYGTTGGSQYGGGAVGIWDAESIVKQIAEDVRRSSRMEIRSWSGGVSPTPGSGGGASKQFLLMMPELAIELDKLGYTREKVQERIAELSAVRYEDLKPEEISAIQRAIEVGYIPEHRASVYINALKPGGMIPVVIDPAKDINIFVVGGFPGYTLRMAYYRRAPYALTAHQIRKISGATLTEAGR